MTEMSKADKKSWFQRLRSKLGVLSGGNPIGTSPTILTPWVFKPNAQVTRTVATTAATGPALVRTSAMRGVRPFDNSKGFNPLRTQNKKATAAVPRASVKPLV